MDLVPEKQRDAQCLGICCQLPKRPALPRVRRLERGQQRSSQTQEDSQTATNHKISGRCQGRMSHFGPAISSWLRIRADDPPHVGDIACFPQSTCMFKS